MSRCNASHCTWLSTCSARKVAENHSSPSVSIPTHSTPVYPTKRIILDLTTEDNVRSPSSSSCEHPHRVPASSHPSSDSVAVPLQQVDVHTHARDSTHNGGEGGQRSHNRGEGGQRETVLGKRKSSERTDPLYCEEAVDAEHNLCKLRRTENSSSSAVTSTNRTVEELGSKSSRIEKDFDSLFASPEIVFDFDQPEALVITEQKVFDQGAVRATSCPQNQQSQSQSGGYRNDPTGIGLMQENEDLQRAMEESLKVQVGMITLRSASAVKVFIVSCVHGNVCSMVLWSCRWVRFESPFHFSFIAQ